jgi:hypothetical protein
MNVRVCPECGEEFRPEIVNCSDCGALLEDRFEGEDAAPVGVGGSRQHGGAPPGAPTAPAVFVRIFHADRAAELDPLAEQLGKAGLPFHVRTVQLSFELLIREEDRERVLSLLGDALRPRLPSADEAPFDPEGGYSACPACGCRLAPRTEECPECGLAVGGEADANPCPRCGQARDEVGRCGTCGPLGEEP